MELEITTTALKKAVKVVVVVALLVALYFAGKWAWPQISGLLPSDRAVTPTPAPDLAMQAAVQGAEAYYTLDAQKGEKAWVEKMCTIVSADDCLLYRQMFGPEIGALFALHPNLKNTATVTKAELVDEQTNNKGNVGRVYRVWVRLSNPWPEAAEYGNPTVVYAHVVRGDDGQWQFVRILFDQEAKYYEATPAPTAQP
ncbi:MAG TPA: hypothetical protein ENJ54_02695 [Chloroflexi bacterium]|nr:hypothetical protein [Chloroflexota bacterium]